MDIKRVNNTLAIRQQVSRIPKLIAQNCYAAIDSKRSGAQTSLTRHVIIAATSGIVLRYGNFRNTSSELNVDKDGTETDGTGTYTVNASIEQSSGIYRVTFGGKVSATIEPGGFVDSDPIGLNFAAGEEMRVRTYISSSSGFWYPTLASWNNTVNGYAGGVRATDDYTAPGSPSITLGTAYLYGPMGIYGIQQSANLPSVAICGDSISVGHKDDPGGSGAGGGYYCGGGMFARALGLTLPWVCIGSSGDRASRFKAAGNTARRMPLIRGCTHALTDYGINDINATPASLASHQANVIAVWNQIANYGARVYHTTITPYTDSTDSWATTGNQTLHMSAGNEAIRTGFNDWLRDGAPMTNGAAVAVGSSGVSVLRAGYLGHPLAGYFETADQAETSRNSGIWKANYTPDGLHPNPTAAAALATAIDVTRFVI